MNSSNDMEYQGKVPSIEIDMCKERSHMKGSTSIIDSASIDSVMELIAITDADGFCYPQPDITRDDVEKAILNANGNMDRAVEDLLGLIAAKMTLKENDHSMDGKEQKDSKMENAGQTQWQMLYNNIDTAEREELLFLLSNISEAKGVKEGRDGEISRDSYLEQLLQTLEDSDMDIDKKKVSVNDHPIQILQTMFPNVRIDVIEKAFLQHECDVNATADALCNVARVGHIQSYAAVVSAGPSKDQAALELRRNGPHVSSNGHFPTLPSQNTKKQTGSVSGKKVNKLPISSVWNDNIDKQHRRSGITVRLKIDRLKGILPSIDRDIIRTTLFLNECNLDATEATLREIFNIPIPETAGLETRNAEEKNETILYVRDGNWSSVDDRTSIEASRQQVIACRKALSNRYGDVLQSFKRNPSNVVREDRLQELSNARQGLRQAQRNAAHVFFLAHENHLRQNIPIDLHGLIVMEALQVLRESTAFCEVNRIRSCSFICGLGNHSSGGSPRIQIAFQLSLKKRQIDFRRDGGRIIVYPLRKKSG